MGMSLKGDIVLVKVKEDWVEEQVAFLLEQMSLTPLYWNYINTILKDHFMSQVEDKTEKEFIVYLRADHGYDDDEIDDDAY